MGRGEGGLGGDLGGGDVVAPLSSPQRLEMMQDLPYADADLLCHDQRWAEGEEGNVDNGDDNKNADGHVYGIRIGQILGTGNGGVHSAMAAMKTRTRRVECIPPHGQWQHAS